MSNPLTDAYYDRLDEAGETDDDFRDPDCDLCLGERVCPECHGRGTTTERTGR